MTKWKRFLGMGLVLFCGCGDGDAPTAPPPPPACQTQITADLTAVNRTSSNMEVFLDGGSIALLRPGERVSRTITAITSHQILMRELNCILCGECRWTVSLPVCGFQTYECTS